MKTFESGGALWVKPYARLQVALTATAIAAAALGLPPVFGIYLLVVA